MSTRTGFGKVELLDDFLLSADASGWNDNTENSGTAAQLANREDGYVTLVTGTTSGNRSQITGERVWRSESGGPLMFEAGFVSITAITLRALYVGLTDATGIENPIEASGSGDGITTTATDAVGFMYDTLADTDVWFAVGVDSDTDAPGAGPLAARFTERTPTAGTDQALKIVINEDGKATFSINGQMVNRGSNISGWEHDERMTASVSPNVNLCPTVVVEARENAAKTVYVDYIFVAKGRNP